MTERQTAGRWYASLLIPAATDLASCQSHLLYLLHPVISLIARYFLYFRLFFFVLFPRDKRRPIRPQTWHAERRGVRMASFSGLRATLASPLHLSARRQRATDKVLEAFQLVLSFFWGALKALRRVLCVYIAIRPLLWCFLCRLLSCRLPKP